LGNAQKIIYPKIWGYAKAMLAV